MLMGRSFPFDFDVPGGHPQNPGEEPPHTPREITCCLKGRMEFITSPVSPGQFSSFSAKSWPHSLDIKPGLVTRLDLAQFTPKPAHGLHWQLANRKLSQFLDHIQESPAPLAMAQLSPEPLGAVGHLHPAEPRPAQHQSCFLQRPCVHQQGDIPALVELRNNSSWILARLGTAQRLVPCSYSLFQQQLWRGWAGSEGQWDEMAEVVLDYLISRMKMPQMFPDP